MAENARDEHVLVTSQQKKMHPRCREITCGGNGIRRIMKFRLLYNNATKANIPEEKMQSAKARTIMTW